METHIKLKLKFPKLVFVTFNTTGGLTVVNWGDIQGDINEQTVLINIFDDIYDKLNNIQVSGNYVDLDVGTRQMFNTDADLQVFNRSMKIGAYTATQEVSVNCATGIGSNNAVTFVTKQSNQAGDNVTHQLNSSGLYLGSTNSVIKPNPTYANLILFNQPQNVGIHFSPTNYQAIDGFPSSPWIGMCRAAGNSNAGAVGIMRMLGLGIHMENMRIIRLADPIYNQDAVNKQYVDALVIPIQDDITNLYSLIGDDVNPNENYVIFHIINNTQGDITIPGGLFNGYGGLSPSDLTEHSFDFGNGNKLDLKSVLNGIDLVPGIQGKYIVKWNSNVLPTFNSTTFNNCIFKCDLQIQSYNGNLPNHFMSNFLNSSMIRNINIDLSNINQTTIGTNFMLSAFQYCNYLTDIKITLPKGVTSFGANFMDSTFRGASVQNGIKNIVINGGDDWTISSIPNYFMSMTCNLTEINSIKLFDTSNWHVTSVGNYFMSNSFSFIQSKEIELFDTSGWNVTTIPNPPLLFNNTFLSGSLLENITLKGGFYVQTVRPFTTNSMGLSDQTIINVKVDPALIPTYQSHASWSNITPSKFVSW